MCLFARFTKIGKKAGKQYTKNGLMQWNLPEADMINVISFAFLLIGVLVLFAGIKMAQPDGIAGIVIDSYEGWLGILIDALLLFSINWALRREERKRLLSQFGSESNAFALDATRQLRKKGWLTNGKLNGIDLSHSHLENANLNKSVLQNVDFSYTNLSGATLIEADLQESNLTAVDLSKAVCRWTDFRNANLRWANLEGAVLDGANFDGADLRFAKLGKINKNTTSFEGALFSENLTEEEIRLVQQSTGLMKQNLDQFADEFYDELFRLNPIVKTLFLSNIKSQAKKFAQMFELLISGLTNIEKLIPALKSLGRRHANYGIEDHHYKVVGTVLIKTLKKSIGQQFTPETENAWAKTFGLVSMIMIDASKGFV